MKRSPLKLVAALIVIAALVALTVIAVKTKGNSTTTKGALAFVAQPHNAASLGGVVTSTADNANDVVGGLTPSDNSSAANNGPKPPTPIAPDGGTAPDGPVAAQLTCPAPLPAATHTGGVADLTPIIPAFGPFSAEAFTFLPAFEPGFPVLGPFFPVFAELLQQGQPVLNAVIPPLNSGEQAFYDAIAPAYNTIRPQVLQGETQAANAIAPVVNALATTPGSGCVADVADVLATLALGVI